MLNRILNVVLFAALGLALISCEDSTSEPTNKDDNAKPEGQEVSAFINGDYWSATSFKYYKEVNQIDILGSDSSGNSIDLVFRITDDLVVGEYKTGEIYNVTIGQNGSIYSTVYAEEGTNSGTITISRVTDKSIEGTFSATAFNASASYSVSVTQGVFKINK